MIILFNKKEFMRRLIDELNDVNERQLSYYNKSTLPVEFMVSVVDQNIESCTAFINELSEREYCFNGFEEDSTDGYTNGRARILVEKEDPESKMMYDLYENYVYYIDFRYDERNWGYCQCSPKDEGYNEEYKCCGMGCDWTAPSFYVYKELPYGGASWKGEEKDYWEWVSKFNDNEDNLNQEIEEKLRLEQIKRLEDEIKEKQKQLRDLQK